MPDWHWVLVGCGVALVVAAIVWLGVSKRAGDRGGRYFSVPTRLVIGLALAVTGYHLVSWFLPSAWAPPGVPIGRWWGLALVVGLLVLVSIATDRFERSKGDAADDTRGG